MAETQQDQTRTPAVSIILPAYRASGYIATAVESALAQTFSDYEVIIINDGSPDTKELERVLRTYAGTHAYIKQQNKGPASARNTGIRAARGRFIAFLDADDYWAPNYLAEQMLFLERNPGADMVYADAILVGNTDLAGRTFMETTPSIGRADFESLLIGQCTVILSGTVVRRDLVMAAGAFDEGLQRAEDYDLWLRLAKLGAAIMYQRKVLLFRRELSTGLCSDKALLFRHEVRVLAKLACGATLSRDQRSMIATQIERMKATIWLEEGKTAFYQRRFLKAALAIRAANQVYDSWKLRLVWLSLLLSPGLLLHVNNLLRRDRIPVPSEDLAG